MKITCPSCGFNRDVPPERLPAGEVTATCPKCGAKFQLSKPANKEEEDMRLTAKRAYEAEAARFEEGGAAFEEDNPWDLAPWPSGWPAAFLRTIRLVMSKPARFFRSLAPEAGLMRPLLFYSIIIILQSSLDRLWGRLLISLLSPTVMDDAQLSELMEVFSLEGNFFMAVTLRFGAMLFQLCLYSFILWAVFRLIAPKKSSFGLLFQICAYSSAPAALSVVPVLGSLAGMIWGFASFIIGIRAALNLSWPQTLLGLSPLLLLYMPALSMLFNAAP